MRLYELMVHVEATPAQPLDGAEGAFIICYLAADTIEQSIQDSLRWLMTTGFRVVEVQQSIRIEPDSWAPPSERHPPANALTAVLRGGPPILGPIYPYERDNDD